MLRFDSEPHPIHRTQKPLDLYDYLVRTYSNPDDLVVDICMGSGTTGVAVRDLGDRRFMGIEMDPALFEIAKKRIEGAEAAEAA